MKGGIFFAIAALSMVFYASCKPRVFNEARTSEVVQQTQFSSSITDKRHCDAFPGQYDSGDKPTRVYHWTNSKKPLSDPKAYLEETVSNGLKIDESWDAKADFQNYGGGLYVALDPFLSSSFGRTLVTFEIKPHSRFPVLISERDRLAGVKERFQQGCPGILYPYSRSAIQLLGRASEYSWALVLLDLASVDPASIRAYDGTAQSVAEVPIPGVTEVLSSAEFTPSVALSSSMLDPAKLKRIALWNFNPIMAADSRFCSVFTNDRSRQTVITRSIYFALSRNTGVGLNCPATGESDFFRFWKSCAAILNIGAGTESCEQALQAFQSLPGSEKSEALVAHFKSFLETYRAYWMSQHTMLDWTAVDAPKN